METDDEIKAIEKAREMKTQASKDMQEVLHACDTEVDNYAASMRSEGLSAATIYYREYTLKRFAKDLEAASPNNVTPSAVQKWFDTHKARHPRTACDYLQTVRLWFKWLKSRGKITSDPTDGIKLPKLKLRRRRSFLLPDQAKKLLKAAKDKPGLKFAIYCGLHAGLRKNEIIEARPSWFDLEAGLLHIQASPTFKPKDNDNRTIPLTEEFKKWLKNDYKLQSPFMLEPTVAHGKYRYRFDFKKAYENLVKKCGLQVTFHDLRRTFASLHVSAGTSIYKVARWMGDGVEVIEESYGHLIPQDDQINNAWAAKKKPAKKAAKKAAKKVAKKAGKKVTAGCG